MNIPTILRPAIVNNQITIFEFTLIEVLAYNDQLSGVCPQLVNSTKVVKSAEAHNGSKWHSVQKVKNSCELMMVESTAVTQRQISRSSCTENSQKALRHMPDQRLLSALIFR